ncbi:DUF2147 domain-containing protein [Paracoccus seriniphilus]|uniref:Uncharacterized conserved protein, DUF2147 family n=1 Tax=Paracoccus seriniphilus TaxID=184748 RepID=A0A239PP75_9RHOB|nr:DUF2147 domain-containing protein [Paracoccus seriniphilus]WCR14743.1 DUF2147 domain-containing protein [Paracoccus seriniphilus]SNT71853.1 Uncharacterized conserved protein, DUF2147 family [Paracoccus seriniphilus]
MKRLVIAAAFLIGATTANADPIEGLWQTQPDEGAFAHVDIGPCGNAYCGVITRTFKGKSEYESPNIGRQIVIDMVPNGDGSYQGKVLRPSNDKIYRGKARVSGDRMQLSGCVAGGLICKSQTWAKIR